MSNYSIKIQDTILNKELGDNDFIFNHPSHIIKVSINESYAETHRVDVRWDFGDGTIVETVNATHYYTLPGIYTISATLYSTNRELTNKKDIVASKKIIVKELVPTELSFSLEPESWDKKKNLYISKNNKLGEIQISIGNNVVGEPKIAAIRKWDDNIKEANYFDIKKEPYYHLQRYYTFLEENYNTSIDKSTLTNGFLKPVNFYTPEYITLYGYIEKENSKIVTKFFTIKSNNIARKINFKPYSKIDGTRNKDAIIIEVNSIKDLPAKCTPVGKIGFSNIWYKNDFESKNDLIFEIKKDTLKFINETDNKESYLNIPNIAFSFYTTSNIDSFKALTSNGLLSDANVIDIHLKHNFYQNYKVEGIYSQFIKNDKLNDIESYNMFKKDIDSSQLFLICDDKCLLNEEADKGYYKIYNFTPQESYFTIKDENKEIYKHGKLVNMENLVLPVEKSTNENLEDVLKVYMQHPMFENTVNLKTALKDILGNNNLFKYIITKGDNFINDNINIKTCYIDKLLSTFMMLDENINSYNIDSFTKIIELKELMRLLSMNYSTIFGNVIDDEYDIKIVPGYSGKNVSDQLSSSDKIYCDDKFNIIGIERDKEIFILSKATPFIIIKDNFTNKTYLGSFFNVPSFEYEDFETQGEEWNEKNKEFVKNVKYIYKIDDYNYQWGWSLNLPDEINHTANKAKFIDTYYSFYLFNPIKSQNRKYNFIDETTIPLDEEGNQISVEEWNKDFGFTYDCLMKILVSYLSKP